MWMRGRLLIFHSEQTVFLLKLTGFYFEINFPRRSRGAGSAFPREGRLSSRQPDGQSKVNRPCSYGICVTWVTFSNSKFNCVNVFLIFFFFNVKFFVPVPLELQLQDHRLSSCRCADWPTSRRRDLSAMNDFKEAAVECTGPGMWTMVRALKVSPAAVQCETAERRAGRSWTCRSEFSSDSDVEDNSCCVTCIINAHSMDLLAYILGLLRDTPENISLVRGASAYRGEQCKFTQPVQTHSKAQWGKSTEEKSVTSLKQGFFSWCLQESSS